MGISFDDAFKAPATTQPAAKPPTQPAPVLPPKLSGGISFDQAFGPSKPKPPGLLQKTETALHPIIQKVESEGKKGLLKLNALGKEIAKNHPNIAAGPLYGYDANFRQKAIEYTNAAFDQIDKDFHDHGNIARGGILAIDGLQALWSPIAAAVDAKASDPIKAGLTKLRQLVNRYQEWTPAEKREAFANGMELKYNNEFAQAIDGLKSAVSPVLQTIAGMVGPDELGITESSLARETASAGKALEDLHGPKEPPPPKELPTASLDKTMGFQGIRDNIPDVISGKAAGHVGWAPDILKQMIPHAKGYAQSLLQKLLDHMDANVTLRFKAPDSPDDSRLGYYIPENHGAGMLKPAITIFTGKPDAIHTIVHESIHAVTVRMLDQFLKDDLDAEKAKLGRDLTPEERLKIATHPRHPMLKEIDQILAETRARAAKAQNKRILGLYGLNGDLPVWEKLLSGKQAPHWTDPAYIKQVRRYEFIAEVMSNPELQEFMANSERYASAGYKFKNMLNQLGLLIGKHLGIKNPHTLQLLNQAMRVGDQLMRMQHEAGGAGKLARSFNDAILGRLPDGEVITKSQVESATGSGQIAMGDVVNMGDRLVQKGTRLRAQIRELQDQMNEALKSRDKQPEAGLLRFRALEKKKAALEEQLYETDRATEDYGRRPDSIIYRTSSAKRNVQQAKTALKISLEQIMRAINPEALGGNAKKAAATIASRLAEHAQNVSRWRYGSLTRAKFWRANDHLAEEFIDKFEKGEKFSDPILERFARKYRDWNQKIYEQDVKNGFKYKPRDHYLPHMFTDPESVAEYFEHKYGNKWGDPGFIKDRTFDFYKEARAAGFIPKFSSPEDIMLARQQASDLAQTQIGILNDLASYGLAVRRIVGSTNLIKEIDADGKVTLKLQKIEANKKPPSYQPFRAPNGDMFWVEPQSKVVLDNAFKSKSLWSDQSLVGLGFRGMMHAKNLIVPLRLSLSLFHPLHIYGIDVSAGVMRSLSGMLSGQLNPVEGFGKLVKSGFDPFFHNPKMGWKVLKAMRGQIDEAAIDPATAEAVKTIIDGGLHLDMSAQYRTNARQAFMNALLDTHADWRRGSPGAVAWDVTRATWHLPWAMLASIQAPIFEHWIPMLKGASYLQDAQKLLEQNPELAEDEVGRKVALRKLAKSAENRYGEMAYNTLFWKRWIKDLAVMNTLSLGWQMGFMREYGGGAMDLGQFVKGSDKMKMIKQGVLDRPLFVASYTTMGGAVAGLMTYAMTGTPPSSLMDYIDPRIGGENADGTPKRVSTMFYSREFVELYKHIQDQGLLGGISSLVMNKSSGLFGLMHTWATGVNSFGEDIRDPNSDLLTKIEETLAYSMGDLEPIALASLKVHSSTTTGKDKALSFSGFTPAPKYVTETRTEAMISQLYDRYVAPQETPFDRVQYSREYRKLKEYYDNGDARYGDLLDKIVQQNQMNSKDIRRLIRTLNMNLPGSVKMFTQLPWRQQKEVLDKMTPDERGEYLLYANKEHLRNSYQPPGGE